MSFDGLQAIVGNALVDKKFCEALLNAPHLVTTDFDLSEVECQAVLSIRASDLEEFAAKLDRWMAKGPSDRQEQGIAAGTYHQAYRLAG